MTGNDLDQRPRQRRAWRLLWLAAPALLAVGCSRVNLYSNLPEREANVMMAALLKEGIHCVKEEGDEEQSWKLLVSVDDFTKSVNVLTDMGYPNDRHESMGDMFQKTGLVSSPTEDRIRYVYALSEELAETISRIDGVVDARVHVVLPNNDPFSKHARPSSASVYIKHRDDVDIAASRAEIKELVAKSIEGLGTDNVEVFLDEIQPILLPSRDEVAFSRVLGISLKTGSVGRFWRLIGGLGAVALVNLVLVLWFAFRDRLPKLPWLTRHVSVATKSEAVAS